MSPPRLPPPAEHRILRAVCGLPPRVQRRLFGPPPRVDGQTLAPDVHALVRMSSLAGGDDLLAGRTPEQARRHTRVQSAAAAARPPIPMASVRDLELPGPGGPLAARHYAPFAGVPGEARPLLLYFHGGGWVIGDLETHDGVCRFLAATAGVAVLAIDYRLAPEHPFPAAVKDAWAAFEWALRQAPELGCDPDRIAVGGDSAGANLAAVVSMLARDGGGPAPAMQLLIYPPTDSAGQMPSRRRFADGYILTKADMDAFERAYLPPGTDARDPRVSILEAPDLRGLAPAYLATAGFDPLRDEGEAFGLRLREAGVRVAIRRHPGLVHSFANLTAVCPSARAAMLEAAGALRLGVAQAAQAAQPLYS